MNIFAAPFCVNYAKRRKWNIFCMCLNHPSCTRMQQQQKTMTVIIFQKNGFRECKFSFAGCEIYRRFFGDAGILCFIIFCALHFFSVFLLNNLLQEFRSSVRLGNSDQLNVLEWIWKPKCVLPCRAQVNGRLKKIYLGVKALPCATFAEHIFRCATWKHFYIYGLLNHWRQLKRCYEP